MGFSVLIPARLTSTRLPNKPLADIAGLPMIVRVAQQAARSQAQQVVVAADDASIIEACNSHGVQAVLTRADHASGSDRLAEACEKLGLGGGDIVVNVQGDEPMIDPGLIDAVARELQVRHDVQMATAAHEIHDLADVANTNVVKVVLDAQGFALYFSRATIPWARDAFAAGIPTLPPTPLLRHVGIYAYRAGFLRGFPRMPQAPIETAEALEQLRALWHGHRIAVHVTATAPGIGVDTPADLERVRALFRA
jgi:3-deoxy-manno-octulosonate cytidylyltransferase (CMP-KDO synthetase)